MGGLIAWSVGWRGGGLVGWVGGLVGEWVSDTDLRGRESCATGSETSVKVWVGWLVCRLDGLVACLLPCLLGCLELIELCGSFSPLARSLKVN